ncbi:phage tail assembly protein [Algoriphagus aestuarii]|nr:phage tail assembly protein [Algoriphagus aestuarii]TMZ72793.1 hypothetical protein EMG21_26155 [Klebsiella pneumoniae]
MAKVTLDQYRKAADEKYASFEIALDSKTTVTLRNPLRIGDEKVRRFNEIIEKMQELSSKGTASEDGWNEVGADEPEIDTLELIPLFVEVFRLVGDKNVEKLIEAIDGDIIILREIFEDYAEAVNLGEASGSEE